MCRFDRGDYDATFSIRLSQLGILGQLMDINFDNEALNGTKSRAPYVFI